MKDKTKQAQKNLTIRVISVILIIGILYIMGKNYEAYITAVRRLESGYVLYRMAYVVGLFIIGVLIDQGRIVKLLSNRLQIHHILRFCVSILLLFLLIFSFPYLMNMIGFGMAYMLLQEGMFRGALSVLSGSLMIQSLTAD